MTDELLTQAQFATLVGVSAPRINKLIKAGRIPMVGKKISKEAGLKAWANREMGYEKAAIAGKKFGGDPRKTKNNGAPRALSDESEDDEENSITGDDEWASRFKIARTLEKEEMARKRKLENEIEEGKWVLKTEVEREAATVAVELTKALNSFPDRICGSLENKDPAFIRAKLEHELNEIIKVLHNNGRV